MTTRLITFACWILVTAIGCGGDNGVPEPTVDANVQPACPPGQTECGDTCVDTSKDRENCGSCGTTCVDGEVCSVGSCALSCQAGLLDCDGTCIDPDRDATYCGATGDCAGTNAGTTCNAGEVCSAGACELSCQDGLIDCDGTCVDPNTDRDYCGATGDCQAANAGVACLAGEICNGAGVCEVSCQAGLLDCGGTCIDPNTNLTYCGASNDCLNANAGTACAPGEACSNGFCVSLGCIGTTTFTFTGAMQTFDVPACATSITIDAYGAQGGASFEAGGLGGRAMATVPVTPGETLYVFVGGAGSTYNNIDPVVNPVGPGGFNGGGDCRNLTGTTGTTGSGGGGSDVRRIMNDLSSRLVVAGGGGGGGWSSNNGVGGAGGGLVGEDGNTDDPTKPAGGGGTQVAGGAVGWVGGNYPNEPGSFGQGGTAYHDGAGNGGGGGGWYGGGTGGFSGGAGGSGFVDSPGATNKVFEVGTNAGDGTIIITWGM